MGWVAWDGVEVSQTMGSTMDAGWREVRSGSIREGELELKYKDSRKSKM